jgi:hypothetical protein
MKTKQRLRTWLTARTWVTLTALVILGVGEGWMLIRMWSDWEQHKYPVGSRPDAVIVSANTLPFP